MKRHIPHMMSGIVGMNMAIIGFPVTSWQFWLVAAPLFLFNGYVAACWSRQ